MLFPARPAGDRRRMAVGFVAVLSLVLVACDGDGGEAYRPRRPATTPTAPDSRLIGLVGTLSGPLSWRGEDAFEGADVAVQELNRRRGENQVPYELVSFDDGGEGDRSIELVEEAATEERMAGIVYAGPPEGLPSAEDALAEAGIPAILVYGDL
jgi:ABC-type branched-subunit amino acid transport system substrate-binding protein